MSGLGTLYEAAAANNEAAALSAEAQANLAALELGIGTPVVTEVSWDEVTDKPETYPPAEHTHTKGQITDFAHTHSEYATKTSVPEAYQAKLTAGSNITIDGNTISATGGGSGFDDATQIAIGRNAEVLNGGNTQGVAIGPYASAVDCSVAIGLGAKAENYGEVALKAGSYYDTGVRLSLVKPLDSPGFIEITGSSYGIVQIGVEALAKLFLDNGGTIRS